MNIQGGKNMKKYETLEEIYAAKESLLFEIDFLKKSIDYQEDKESKYCLQLKVNLAKANNEYLELERQEKELNNK